MQRQDSIHWVRKLENNYKAVKFVGFNDDKRMDIAVTYGSALGPPRNRGDPAANFNSRC